MKQPEPCGPAITADGRTFYYYKHYHRHYHKREADKLRLYEMTRWESVIESASAITLAISRGNRICPVY